MIPSLLKLKKLRSAGMLSDAALQEAEHKIKEGMLLYETPEYARELVVAYHPVIKF